YLEVDQNYNQGWTATLDEKTLTPVRLDGWQQGFVLPAGPGGTGALSFPPAASYHLALVGSLAAIVALLALTGWSFLRRGTGSAPDGSPPDQGGAALAVPVRAWQAWLGLLGVTALLFVVSGPMALAVPVLAGLGWLVARRWASLPVLAMLAFAGMAVSGLLAALRTTGSGLLGTFGAPAEACALVALAAALVPAVPVRRASKPRPFGVIDELSCYFDSSEEPNNVHLELWLPGHLDGARLSEAVRGLLDGEPAARVRRAAGRRWRRRYAWEVPAEADRDPLSVTNWRTGAELDAARVRFLAAAPPLGGA